MKTLATSFLAVTTLLAAPALQAQTPAPASYMLCMACHGMDGKGMGAGTPTPMAPPLAGSKLAGYGDGELMASIVFTGIEKQDAKFIGIMAPLGPAMTDAQMAEALTYVRSSFGNNAPAVTADQIKAWREKYNGKPMQKRADLEAKLK
jgi:mono/diheme cytochrome c family protein